MNRTKTLSIRFRRTPDTEPHKKSLDNRDLPPVKEEGDNSVFDGGGGESKIEDDIRGSVNDVSEKIVKEEILVDGKDAGKSDCLEDGGEVIEPDGKISKDIQIKQETYALQEQRSQLDRDQEERPLENEDIKRLQEDMLREDANEKEFHERKEEQSRTEQRENTRIREQEEVTRQQQESRIQRVQDGLRIKQESEWNNQSSATCGVSEQRRNAVSSDRSPVLENQERQWHSPVAERWHSPIVSDRIKYPPVHSERVIVERQRHSPPGVIERVRLSPEQQRVRSSPELRMKMSPDHPRVSPEQNRLRLSPEQQHGVRLSPEQQQRLSPLIQRGSPVIQRQVSGGDQNNSGRVINLISSGGFWVNPSTGGRINGVRPELIGGNVNMNVAFPSHIQGSDMKPPRPLSTPSSPGTTRQAPTVIMGEAGGVRTMIWSQPNPTSPNDHPAQNMAASTSAMNWSSSSQSSAGGASSNSSEESAAQLLLNLGQPERQQSQQQCQPQQNQQQQHPHYAQPLNMERLWAGDLTQLPASQQNQALNLALPPGPWPREGKPQAMTVIGESRHDPEDDEQPMICMICEDRATGLHYGIITCEG